MTSWLSGTLARKHDVYVLSMHLENSTQCFPLSTDVTGCIIKDNDQSMSFLGYLRRIWLFLRYHRIDVMILVDTGMCIYGIPSAIGTKTKTITWEHANYYNNWGSRWFPYFRRYAARHSSAMVVLTERDKQNYLRNVSRCRPVSVIPNPAEIHTYAYDTDAKIILSAGILGRIKRFELLIPIGKNVFARHPDWQWFLCGDGPERMNLENAVNEAGLAEHIRFCGSVQDMGAMYRRAAMYVLTSEMEGLPMVLLEAKSYGLPIVSFDIETGPSDIVRDGVNGYLVPSGDTEAMAEKICRLIEDSILRKQFSDAAVLDMEKFDEGRILELWEEMITNL